MKESATKQGLISPLNKIYFQEWDHKYFLDEEMTKEVPCISDILKHFGYSDYERLIRMGCGAAVDAAAEYGKVIHDTCTFYDLGILKSYDPQIEKELEAWKIFLVNKSNPVFTVIEQPLYSRVWGFAGTPDRFFGKEIPEIKTCDPRPSHEIQTAFQQILIEENFNVKIKSRYTVQLTKKGYKIHSHKNKNDVSLAKCMMQIYNDKKQKGLL